MSNIEQGISNIEGQKRGVDIMKFEPAIYEHAAKLIGKTPWEVSRSKELMVRGHKAAFDLYRHTPVVVGIDIYNLEAEAFGSVIAEPDGAGIPAPEKHLCDEVQDILKLTDFDPATSGRLAMVIEAARELKELLPDAVVKVPVSGPFSLASNLCGLENLLCDCMTDPEVVQEALEKLTQNQLRFVEAIHAAGIEPTFFESAATPPLVPPHMFETMVLPFLKRVIGNAPCIIGGNTEPILETMLSTGTKYVICPGETDQAAFMKKMEAHSEVMVRINMKPSVFCTTDTAVAFAEADRVMALAQDREKVCIGSGVLPYEAVPETVLAVKRYIENAAE
jgi:uroporphyrinogen decarboxylase